ncbi:MAG: ATP-binding cassette domain-containing protein, partial [Actinomycetota bacterium]|nr:ATP-binding cassette domain-containing protein [Actinomycetota bacterium]
GQILVAGEVLDARSPYDAIRKGVVFVPSDRLLALLPKRSVRENLTLPLYNDIGHWFTLAGDESARVGRAVDRLDIDTRAQSQVRRLSGGNQQKVVLGRWLASGFSTLLCFDPTRGIDLQTKRQIYDLLRELADDGAAVLIYTSELQEIPLVCDRVLVLYDGKFVHEQDAATATEEILLSKAHGLVGAK